MATIAQAEILGSIYRRLIKFQPKHLKKLFYEREVDIVAAFNDELGTVQFLPGIKSPVPPADLAELSFQEAEAIFDHSMVTRALETTRKQEGGASHSTTDINRLIIDRGGDPTFRTPKPESSFLFKEGKRIKKMSRGRKK